MDFRSREDAAGIRASGELLEGFIRRELDGGVAPERIVLAGFSQGGAMVLHTGLRYPQALGGILVLSAYLPLADALEAERSATNATVPILQAHGRQDPVVPLAWAELTRDRLRALGYAIDWKTYPMPHAVCPDEVADIRAWLDTVLGGEPG
jgi:phospholipase/carboxylesterase